MGLALAQAQVWLGKRSDGIPEVDRRFIVLSRKAARRRTRRLFAIVGVLTLGIPKREEAKPKQIKINVATPPMAAAAGAK